ncbi:PAS domain S-box protein [Luteolibacter soli]|uniref:histidine kinase n=1 Tax=Luteolibacter soli TaxID=3135280 RepID=A0ABU9B5U2_9BACT
MSLKPPSHPPVFRSLFVGALITAVAVTVRWLLNPWLGERLSLVTLFPAVAAGVWIAGYRAGLVPAIAGYVLCDVLFMTGNWPSPQKAVSLATYAAAVSFVIAAGESMRRHRALAEARKNLLQVTLESIGDGVITTDAGGKVMYLNSVATKLTGWSVDDARGHLVTDVFSIINESSRDLVPNPVLRALEEKKVVGLANHSLLLSKHGVETPIDDSAAPIGDGLGRLLGGVLIFRDISERRATEAKQRQSEQRHRFLAELAMATQHLSDEDEIMFKSARMLAVFMEVDRCAYAVVENEAVFDITGDFGPTVPSIVGRWDVAAFGPACVERMLANEPYVVQDADTDPRVDGFREAYRATQIRSVICVPLHKGGKFTAAMAVHQTTPRCWTQADIEVVTIVVNRCWESLERARSNRGLEKAAERLSLALAAAQLGDWSWDANTDVVDLSPRAAEIFGLASGRSITWSAMQELLNPNDSIVAARKVNEAIADRSQYEAEYRVQRGGSEVWVAAKGRATYDEEGNATGMFGVVKDVTARKEMESTLQQKAMALAAADRQKDDFIALLSHELRNPLAPVRTGLELLREGECDAERLEKVRSMMERQLNHMVRLVDDLLDVSRITRNKLSLDLGPVELSNTIELASEAVRPALQALEQRITLDLPDQPVWVWGDATRLSQVFGNVIANASKFSPRGSDIEVVAQLKGSDVAVTIKDHGVGIDPDDLPKVFNIFAQAERSKSASKEGLGLGLHLARSLMQLQNGVLEAASAGLGQGSEFTVRMPLLGDQEDRQDPSPRMREQAPLKGRKVLVVDDNADALESLAMLLEMIGAEVIRATGGEMAIELAERGRPEVILMDVGMPGVDGLQAAKAIRSSSPQNSPVIIALTGWGRLADRKATRDAGFDGHVVKPVKLDDLEALILPLLGPI